MELQDKNNQLQAKTNSFGYAMSRRKRSAILSLCVLAAAAIVWFDHSHIAERFRLAGRIENTSSSSYDIAKYHRKIFEVVKVVDGDTIDIDIPDGRHQHTRIRLWGVDTPETKNPETGVMYFGPEASEFTKESTLGKKVTIYLDEKHTRDKYDRLLAYIQLPSGEFLNKALVAEGYAYADVRFKHEFYYKYQQLEASARKGKKGLWEKVTREQLPQWLQRERPELLLNK